MKKNEKNTTATTEPTTEKKVSGITRAKKDAVAPAEKKPAADQKPATDSKKTATDQKPATDDKRITPSAKDGLIPVLMIDGDDLIFRAGIKPPVMVTRPDDFAALLNSELIGRYADLVSVRLKQSRDTLDKRNKELEAGTGAKSEVYAKLLKAVDTAAAAVTKFEKLNGIIAKARPALEADAARVPDQSVTDQAQAVLFFSLFYSTVAGIDDNKLRTYVVRGMHDLHSACCHYADAYETSAAIEWDQARKDAFNAIKDKMTAIGSRLNGAASDYRKGYSYQASTKDVNRAIALCTRRNEIEGKSGALTEKRVKLPEFQRSILATFFRRDVDSFGNGNEVEC